MNAGSLGITSGSRSIHGHGGISQLVYRASSEIRGRGRRLKGAELWPGRLNLQILCLSILVIVGFLYFEKIVRLVPCELCLAERLPWYAALTLSAMFVVWHPRPVLRSLPLLFAVLFLMSTLLAGYHVLVEHHFVAGPTACTAPSSAGESVEALKRQLLATPPVRCDEVQWSLIGISLAGWNVVASLLAIGLSVAAMPRPR
jgi:disulfide bond formation protein DsbB